MVYSVDQLKSVISKRGGVARSNVFRVTLPSLGEKNGGSSREFDLLCKAANIPGKALATTERTIGPITESITNGIVYADVSLTFMVLNDYGIRDYFDRWQALAFDQEAYELGYKREYVKTVKIDALKVGFGLPVYQTPLGLPKLPSNIQNRLPKIGPFDLAQGEIDLDIISGDDVTYSVELIDAFPKSVTGFDYNNDPDGIVELQVELAYSTFKSKTEKQNPINDAIKLGLGSLASRVGQLI